jgi:hypothetical protein
MRRLMLYFGFVLVSAKRTPLQKHDDGECGG